MRALLPRSYKLHLWILEATEDGFAEVMIECNDRPVATRVWGPGVDLGELIRELQAEVDRHC